MRTDLFYFTGTGNSLAVARMLADELGGARLRSIAAELKSGGAVTTDAEAVGIVYPVYMWGPPLMVVRFCRRFAPPQTSYVFSVATYGASPGATTRMVRDRLREQGVELASGFGVAMPGNYTPLYGAIPVEKQRNMFQAARTKAVTIAESVRQRRAGLFEGSGKLVSFLFSRLLYPRCAPRIPAMDRRFLADSSCNGCGVCARVCPVENIEMIGGRPAWLHHCEQCMACLQWCPQTAIQFGSRTVGRRRYRHPDVRIQDLAG